MKYAMGNGEDRLTVILGCFDIFCTSYSIYFRSSAHRFCRNYGANCIRLSKFSWSHRTKLGDAIKCFRIIERKRRPEADPLISNRLFSNGLANKFLPHRHPYSTSTSEVAESTRDSLLLNVSFENIQSRL
jgi:hypothetical protein